MHESRQELAVKHERDCNLVNSHLCYVFFAVQLQYDIYFSHSLKFFKAKTTLNMLIYLFICCCSGLVKKGYRIIYLMFNRKKGFVEKEN